MGEEVRPRGDKCLTQATQRGNVASSLSLLRAILGSLPPRPSDQSCFLPGGPQSLGFPCSSALRALPRFPQLAPGAEVHGRTCE